MQQAERFYYSIYKYIRGQKLLSLFECYHVTPYFDDITDTIMCKNNEKNDKFYRKVAILMYTEMVNFRPQSWKAASKLKPHRGLGTRLPSYP